MKVKNLIILNALFLLFIPTGSHAMTPTSQFEIGDSFTMVLTDLNVEGRADYSSLPGTTSNVEDTRINSEDIGLEVTYTVKTIINTSTDISNHKYDLNIISTDSERDIPVIRQYPAYDTPFIYSDSTDFKPVFIIYNDWEGVKAVIEDDYSDLSGKHLIDYSWTDTLDEFNIHYEMNTTSYTATSKTSYISDVSYRKDTGIVSFFKQLRLVENKTNIDDFYLSDVTYENKDFMDKADNENPINISHYSILLPLFIIPIIMKKIRSK